MGYLKLRHNGKSVVYSFTSNTTNSYQESELHVQKKFTQYLVFLGLNLLQTYDGPPALKVLEKDQEELLQVFTDLSKVGPSERSCAEIQRVSLVRFLLEFSGGRVDAKQHERYPHTTGDNLSQYGSLID